MSKNKRENTLQKLRIFQPLGQVKITYKHGERAQIGYLTGLIENETMLRYSTLPPGQASSEYHDLPLHILAYVRELETGAKISLWPFQKPEGLEQKV